MESKLDFVSVIDKRTDINSYTNKQYGVYRGGSQNTFRSVISNTYDNNQISWSFTPPSQNTFVSRRMNIRMSFKLTFTGQSAGPGVHLLQAAGLPTAPGVSGGVSYKDGPRAYPLSEAFKTLAVQLNNDSTSTNLSTYSRILQRYARDIDEENKEYSLTPSMSDKSQSYDDLQNFPLNPLGAYGDNVNQCPRGGFTGAVITRNDSTGAPGDIAEVTLTVVEPCWLSPWSFSKNLDSEVAWISIQNISVQATLGGRGSGLLTGLSSSLWSHAPSGSALSSISTEVLGGTLLMNYISPDPTQPIPIKLTYSYFEPTLYPTSTSTPVPPGGQVTLNMNNVQLSSIPNRMMIWASQRDQDVNVTSTNTYMRIDNLNITFNNQDGILSNMSQEELYLMSVRNGCNMSYQQFTKHIGSVLAVGFGQDVPLDALTAPGLRGSTNLTLQVTCTNISSQAIVPTLNVLVIAEGVMFINGTQISRSIGVLDQQTVLSVREQTPISYQPSKNFYGGGFWDDVGSFLKKLVRPAIDMGKMLVPPQFQPLVQGADSVAKSFGLGLGRYKGSALLDKEEMRQLTY